MKYGVVIPARNERGRIEKTIGSISNQSLKPEIIVVIDDSSEDGTGELAKKLGARVVRYDRTSKENMSGTSHIPMLINTGLKELEPFKLDYVMISGADCIYPQDYVERLSKLMKEKGEVVASGVVQEEISRDYGVRGTGRLIDARWFRSLGFRFPERVGSEAWLIYRALKEGKKVGVHTELKFTLMRPTEINVKKAELWGMGMRALNYWWVYALGRSLLLMARSPSLGLAMLKGYLSEVEKYEDLRDFVPSFQRKLLLRRIKEILIGQ